MARDFSKNTSNYVMLGLNAIGPALNGASHVSVAAWINPDTTNSALGDNTILAVRGGSSTSMVRLTIEDTAGTVYAACAGRSASTDSYQSVKGTTYSVSMGAWSHLAGTLDYPADQISVYKDGQLDVASGVTFGNTSYTHGTSASADEIGGVANVTVPTSTATQFDGRIAELAIWAGDLSSDDVAALADGWSPLLVQPSTLAAYWPLLGYASPELNYISGVGGTISGTVAKAAHPRMVYSRRHRIYVPASGVTDTARTPTVASVALTGKAPVRVVDALRAPTVAALALTGLAPVVVLGHPRTVGVGSVAVTGAAPVRVVDAIRAPGVGSLLLSSAAPVVTVQPGDVVDTAVPIPDGALLLAGLAPTRIENHIRHTLTG